MAIFKSLQGIRRAAWFFAFQATDDDIEELPQPGNENVLGARFRASDGFLSVEFARPGGSQVYVWSGFPEDQWEEFKDYASSGQADSWVYTNLCQGAAGGGSSGMEWWVDDYEGAVASAATKGMRYSVVARFAKKGWL